MSETDSAEKTFPVRVAARMTGLTPELLRAWERRYGVVEPRRTAGGTRRYTSADLDRLQLLRRAVDAGHRIGDIADLDSSALRDRILSEAGAVHASERLGGWIAAVLERLQRLDSEAVRTLLREESDRVGALAFARGAVLPLVYEIGERWSRGELSVAAEHLASSMLQSMLRSALRERGERRLGPRIVFATPAGERHELGLLVAALTAREAGASPIYLGADVPEPDLIESVRRSRAAVVALGIVSLPGELAVPLLEGLRKALPDRTQLWIGGRGALDCRPIRGVDRIDNLDQLAAHVSLIDFGHDDDDNDDEGPHEGPLSSSDEAPQ